MSIICQFAPKFLIRFSSKEAANTFMHFVKKNPTDLEYRNFAAYQENDIKIQEKTAKCLTITKMAMV